MAKETKKKEKLKCVQVLLPALQETKEQKEMAQRSLKSLVSFDYCVKVTVDKKRYKTAVAGAWNALLDKWRGKDYDYLMITASDVEHDPNCIDYLVKCMEENPKAGIVSVKVTRDYEDFKKNFGQYKYTSKLTQGLKDPATFMLRKGVIEKVGRIDEYFPFEFVERDFIHRCKLAGYDWIQPDIILEYHPPRSGTIGNPQERLDAALRRYMAKWGGDANSEVFTSPFNNLSLDYTYCVK